MAPAIYRLRPDDEPLSGPIRKNYIQRNWGNEIIYIAAHD
jgi:hypothetical protein